MNPLKIIGDVINSIISIFDDAYREGYLLYLLIGIIILFLIIIIFNRNLLS